MKLVKEALDFARLKHLGQMYGDLPYFIHVQDTVDAAKSLGYSEASDTARTYR
jgi:hypothetical protein